MMHERSLRDRFEEGETYGAFLARSPEDEALWRRFHARAEVPREILERLAALPGRWHLLALSEDWCGDSLNTLPHVARLAARVPGLDLRILDRDRNLDLMDGHLTDGGRSIPVILILDGEYRERAWWGPRPRPLQEWFEREGASLPKADRYREIRRWHARDRGRTTLEEITALLEAAAGEMAAV